MVRSEDIPRLLEEQERRFNQSGFIADDPIQIPHRFSRKEDQEIAGFLAATIAWGQRVTILNNANRLMEAMDQAPFDFLMNHSPSDINRFESFVHRTFNGEDAMFFIARLAEIYKEGVGLEGLFQKGFDEGGDVKSAISLARKFFFDAPHMRRSEKHFSDPMKGSAAKRLNMYLRWMVRRDDQGVDFGLWKGIPMSALKMPLDVHTGNVARHLGILSRKQNDWRAVEELTDYLLELDKNDPVKYDYALFGMGTTKMITGTSA